MFSKPQERYISEHMFHKPQEKSEHSTLLCKPTVACRHIIFPWCFVLLRLARPLSWPAQGASAGRTLQSLPFRSRFAPHLPPGGHDIAAIDDSASLGLESSPCHSDARCRVKWRPPGGRRGRPRAGPMAAADPASRRVTPTPTPPATHTEKRRTDRAKMPVRRQTLIEYGYAMHKMSPAVLHVINGLLRVKNPRETAN